MPSPAEILGPKGRIAARMPHYEHRSQQLAMAEAVDEAIRGGHHLVVEAGTGVGKSFAYLVPAVLATGEAEDGENPIRRVVISTHTISLQEQLIEKDLPFLAAVMPTEFTAVLAKGRGNYLSLRRLGRALTRAGSLFFRDEEYDQLSRINAWAKKTSDGSLSDLDFRPLPQVWDEVASDHGNCMGRKCPRYEDCFYYRARRRIGHAQVLVVNHALLFSDLALRREGWGILPDYRVVVFDEAHNMEAVAGDHLGLGVTSGQVEYTLNKLYNERTNRGLLVHQRLNEAQQDVIECRHRADDFFTDVDDWLAARRGGNGRVREPKIVRNPLSEGLEKLAGSVGKHAAGIQDPEERQRQARCGDSGPGGAPGVRRRPGSPSRVGRVDRRLAIAAAFGFGLLDRGDRAEEAAADQAGRRADRRRAAIARALVRPGGDRGDDQRHAGHRGRLVRFLQVAGRAHASGNALSGKSL